VWDGLSVEEKTKVHHVIVKRFAVLLVAFYVILILVFAILATP
jgi:hypothetical protein